MTSLIGRNLAAATGAVALWLGFMVLELRAGHSAWLDALYLISVIALSTAFWWLNRALARRARSPESGVLWLGGVAALLTAATLVVGALASAALRQWWGA